MRPSRSCSIHFRVTILCPGSVRIKLLAVSIDDMFAKDSPNNYEQYHSVHMSLGQGGSLLQESNQNTETGVEWRDVV